jgi:bifunctional DNA-binding transcriptional regulator/antitoxin component of YhaV-PrlF toxin-antitoxin module
MMRKVKNKLPPSDETGPLQGKAGRRSTRISAKHQVTIPAGAFEGAGLAVGDRLEAKPVGVGKVLLERVDSSVGRYAGAMTGIWDKDELEHMRDEWD